MKSLSRSARRVKDSGGAFLPAVFFPLEQAKIKARMGTATFVAGPPGAMKTGFVLYWVLRLNKPTLYFSADAEDFEIVERSAAALTGVPVETVRADPEKYIGALEEVSNVRFVFEDSPTYDDVELELAAYAEVFGRFPEVIVIDNLMNVVGESDDEWASMRDSARVIHRITRITRAAVFVLHHMSDDRTDPSTPAPRKSLQGKVGQLPKAILSTALDGNLLRIAAVKNRWGPADPTGKTFVTLYVDLGTNRLFNSMADYQMQRAA